MTTHADIEVVAFSLFASQGFDETTTQDIAVAAGIGRRTLFRYYPSKQDIPWGQFEDSLVQFRETLRALPTTVPVWEAVQAGVVAFNTFDDMVIPQHRIRMRLILETPALQAHSVLMYQRWRGLIAEYVAERTGGSPEGLLPRTAAHVSLALAISAYEEWLASDRRRLEDVLSESLWLLRGYFGAK